MKRALTLERDTDGILHIGGDRESACRHCGAGGIPVLSTDGRTCWWRVPLDCCERARQRAQKASSFDRVARTAAAAKAASHSMKTGLPYKDQP